MHSETFVLILVRTKFLKNVKQFSHFTFLTNY